MKAEEARKITFEHSQRMKNIYSEIKKAAERGSNSVTLHTLDAGKLELEILNKNGYTACYEIAPEDGMQYVLVKW